MKIITYLILALSLLISPSAVLAQSSSSTDSASVEDVQKSLQERIRKAIKENLNGNTQIERTKAFFGKLTSISENVLTLERPYGGTTHTYQVTVGDSSKIVSSGKNIKLTDLTLDSNLIIMGKTSDDQNMQAQRVVVNKDTSTINRLIKKGVITEIDTGRKKMTITQGDQESVLDYSTRIKIYQGDTLSPLTIKELNTPTKALFMTLTDSEDDSEYVIRIVALESSQASSSSQVIE